MQDDDLAAIDPIVVYLAAALASRTPLRAAQPVEDGGAPVRASGPASSSRKGVAHPRAPRPKRKG